MAEQPAPRAIGWQLHAAEIAAMDTRDAVVTREALIDEGVVGIEQVEDAAVLVHDGIKQHLGFAAERLPQAVVEVLRVSLHPVELAKVEPLAGEVLNQLM